MSGSGDKIHHIFDSFEGVSCQTDADRGCKFDCGDLAMDAETVERNLERHKGKFILYRGWIPSEFYRVEDRRFCLVHIDVDMYRPYKDSLEFFYPRLSVGGVIICDDYGSYSTPGSKIAVDEFCLENNVVGFEIASGQFILPKVNLD
jgi:hypothetical protein